MLEFIEQAIKLLVDKPDEVKVIKGLGFPSKNSYKCGDLLIKFEIIFPDNIDQVKKDLMYLPYQ